MLTPPSPTLPVFTQVTVNGSDAPNSLVPDKAVERGHGNLANGSGRKRGRDHDEDAPEQGQAKVWRPTESPTTGSTERENGPMDVEPDAAEAAQAEVEKATGEEHETVLKSDAPDLEQKRKVGVHLKPESAGGEMKPEDPAEEETAESAEEEQEESAGEEQEESVEEEQEESVEEEQEESAEEEQEEAKESKVGNLYQADVPDMLSAHGERPILQQPCSCYPPDRRTWK